MEYVDRIGGEGMGEFVRLFVLASGVESTRASCTSSIGCEPQRTLCWVDWVERRYNRVPGAG